MLCCSESQCVVVRCSVLRLMKSEGVSANSYTGMLSCSVLQCVAVCCSVLQWTFQDERHRRGWKHGFATRELQCVTMCCSVLQLFKKEGISEDECIGILCCSVLQCVAMNFSRLKVSARMKAQVSKKWVAVCFDMLQWVATAERPRYLKRHIYIQHISRETYTCERRPTKETYKYRCRNDDTSLKMFSTCWAGWEDRTHKQQPLAQQELVTRGGGLGSRPKKMYGERLGDGVEYHLMKPTPRR